MRLASPVTATEFHIVYHDNSGGLVPGPSDWDIRAVMRVEEPAAWTEGKGERAPFDLEWAGPLLSEGLRPTSQPTYYENATTQIAIFAPEKIVFLRSTTIP